MFSKKSASIYSGPTTRKMAEIWVNSMLKCLQKSVNNSFRIADKNNDQLFNYSE
jgi:hypothetical protein